MEHPISQRIKIIINNESNGKVVDFANRLDGIPYQVISRLFKKDSRSGKFPTPSTDIILEIINKFTLYRIDWLITGRGEMLISDHNKSANNIKYDTSENEITIGKEEANEYDRKHTIDSDIYWRGRYDELLSQYNRLLEELKNK